jgi:hypothetical protein
MARGRPSVPKAPTKFMNKKHRVIMMTADGKYVVKTDKGMAYNPKAAFVKSPGGSVRTITNSNARVPTAIRPKAVRKVRSNRGAARGAYAGVKVGALPALFGEMGPKRGRGRPRKYRVSPGGNMGLAALFGEKAVRKMRTNKGVKRGARVGKKTLAANPYAALG